ncbi:MAG: PEP-CTERM sorting domain-containing protein, partial [Akkermansiaceae bacterium]
VGGYTTSTTEVNDGGTDYFTRTDGSDIGSVNYTPSGFFFAAQDIDGDGAPNPSSLTWTVDITGATALSFYLNVAEDDEGSNQDWDSTDFVHIFYTIDTDPEQNLIWFENDGTTFNAAPLLDTDFDGNGDSTEVTNSFANFSNTIAGTGSSLAIRVEFSLNSGDEDFAIDDLVVEGTVVPEPSSSALLGLGGLALILRRRK